MKNIAIIPARSGSKGLKDKNIRELAGKPLITYTIEAAHKSELFDTIHVSTDSEIYANIAKKYDADVPFLRSPDLSSDTASTWDAVKYVLNQYGLLGKSFDTVTVLQPTSPLRTADDIIGAFKFFKDQQANMISSVCEMEHSPLWCNTLPDDFSMANFEDDSLALLPRQSLPVFYRENGAIYILKITYLLSATNIYRERCYAYIMQDSHSVDIDNELDFVLAQTLMNYQIQE